MNVSRRSAAGLLAAAALVPVAPASAQQQVQLPGGAPDVIALLEAEHRAALSLVSRMIATTDSHERADTLSRLGAALTIHNANEENIVYPAIRDTAHRPADATMLYHQQDDGKVVIAELTMLAPSSAAFTDLARKLQAALRAHIHQEETVDFPAVRTALGPGLARLNVLTAQLRAHWNPNP
jgi:hypothetical protein